MQPEPFHALRDDQGWQYTKTQTVPFPWKWIALSYLTAFLASAEPERWWIATVTSVWLTCYWLHHNLRGRLCLITVHKHSAPDPSSA